MSVENRWSCQLVSKPFLLFSLVPFLVLGINAESNAQRLDAPQSRVLYEADGYSVQAVSLGLGHAIVTNTESGIIKTMLVVQPYDIVIQTPRDEDRGRDRTSTRRASRASRLRDADPQDVVNGLSINGTSQRIVGLACDDLYASVLVAGLHLPNPERRGAEGTKARVRVMLHVFDHRTAARVFSWEVTSDEMDELPSESLASTSIEMSEGVIACLGWSFDLDDGRYVQAVSPDGGELSLPTEATTLRMRDV